MRFSYILMEPLNRFASDAEILQSFGLLKNVGYDGVELNLTEPLGVPLPELKRWLSDLGLVVPSLLTGTAYEDGLCLSHPSDTIRLRAVERLTGFLNTAAELDSILVIGLLQGLRSDEPDPQIAGRRIADSLRTVAEAAELRGVDLVIEPVNHLQVGFHNSVAEVRQLIATIGSPAIRPMVDTIHLNIEEASLTDPIRACGDELRHVHLCENNGKELGSGHIDFGTVLATLAEIDYCHFGSVKVYRQPLESAAGPALEYLKQYL